MHCVAVIGATGTNGVSITNALLKDSRFAVRVLTRPSSTGNTVIEEWKAQGARHFAVDYDCATALTEALRGVTTVVSAISGNHPLIIEKQKLLIDVAKSVGVKRFIPSDWSTFLPQERGVMRLADNKLDVRDYLKASGMPYTFVDIGNWHLFTSWDLGIGPQLPPYYQKGRALIINGGKMKNANTHVEDVGRFIAEIICDDRTLNRWVCCAGAGYSTQLETLEAWELMTGQKLERFYVSGEALQFAKEAVDRALSWRDEKADVVMEQACLDYAYSKHVRGDNSSVPREALDGSTLYPMLRTKTWAECLRDLAQIQQESFTITNERTH